MLCGNCGYDNLDDARYCAICGSASTEMPGEVRADAGTHPCPSCGFLNEDIASYCRSCGKKMKKRTSGKASKKTAPSMPPPETAEEAPSSQEPAVQEGELAVLFGLDAADAGEAAPAAEAGIAAEPGPGEVPQTAGIEAEIEAEAVPESGDEPEPETTPPSDDDRLVTNPEEMAELIAMAEAEAPLPGEEAVAELPSAEPAEPAAQIAEVIEEAPGTPISEPEAPASPRDGGMITDRDEMTRLTASAKSEEPAPLEPAELAATAEQVADPLETAAEVPEPEVPADADALSTYASTPHESVEAVFADEAASGDDDAEAASAEEMPELSSIFNALIKDLLDLDIEEKGGADAVDTPASVFPLPDPGQYVQPVSEPTKAPRLPSLPKLPTGLRFRDAAGYLVLAAAFLLSGLSIGLWVWYLFVS